MWGFVLFVLHVCSIAVICACGIAVFCDVVLLDINSLLCDICRCAFCFYVHLPLFLTNSCFFLNPPYTLDSGSVFQTCLVVLNFCLHS